MKKTRHLLAGLLSLVAAQVVSAQEFTVMNNADTGAGSLRDAISQANAYNGPATINFGITNSTVNLGSMLPILSNPNGITINGNGNTINGGSTSNTTGDRVFFIGVPANTPAAGGGFMLSTADTIWNINNLTIQNGRARGGNTGLNGGGGAGLGGGVFLNAGNLTLSSVNLANNRAVGGSSNVISGSEGGGGMGGNGGGLSGGGFGLGSLGGAAGSVGAAGAFTNGAPGGNGAGGAGGVNGGGGGGQASNGLNNGGGGGVGGGNSSGTIGGNGGFGGGGGGSVGNGGFGGGGGFQGSGGFGGGNGDFNGDNQGGGGGLGAGGAIFVRQGANLTLRDGGISGGTVTGGLPGSGGATAGQAIGSGIFLAGTVNYSVTSGTVTINDTLGGGVNAQITGGFTKSGAGTLVLGGTNSYTGGTNLNDGILSVSSNANLGNVNSALTFNGGTLQVTGTTFTSTPRAITWGANGGGFDIADAANAFTVAQTLTSGGSLTKTGAGKLVLSGANTYTGGTTLAGSAGSTLQVGSNYASGASPLGIETNSLTIQAGNTLDGNGKVIRLGALSGAGTITTTSTTAVTPLEIGYGNASSTFTGLITQQAGASPLRLIKVGSGVITLTGNNTYTDETRVVQGTLLVNGFHPSTFGDYTVFTAGTLGGNGTIGRGISAILGAIAPGNVNDTGILTLNGGATFQPTSSLRIDLQGSVAGGGYDQLVLNAPAASYLIGGGSQLIGDRLGSFEAPFLSSYVILKNTNNVLGTGTFAGLADGSFFNFDDQVFQIRYNVPNTYNVDPQLGITWAGDNGFGIGGADNGGNIVIAAVPEPSTWALMLGSLGICGYAAYRRHRSARTENELILDRDA